jgi:hypothetical protein
MDRTATNPATEIVPDLNIVREISRIQSMRIAELRALWGVQMKSEPPKAFGPDLLRRSLAQRLQERAYGGLDPTTARLLNQLIAQSAKNAGKIVLPRRTKPGTLMVREWKGKRHSVTVAKEGFIFEGKPCESLSEIARLITGTRWNGPRFFGLRSKEQTDGS